jgi:hypothetical protein
MREHLSRVVETLKLAIERHHARDTPEIVSARVGD